MKEYIREIHKYNEESVVKKQYDVLVAGGGMSGLGALLMAGGEDGVDSGPERIRGQCQFGDQDAHFRRILSLGEKGCGGDWYLDGTAAGK